MSIQEVPKQRSVWTWKCPECRKKGEAISFKTAQQNLALHLKKHQTLKEKALHWAGTVEANLPEVKTR